MRALITAAVAAALAVPAVAAAQRDRVGEAIDKAEQTTREAGRSQQRVDKLDDASRRALGEYRRALWEAQQLKVYSQQLAELQKLQGTERQALQAALDDVPLKAEDLMPLMLRMVDTLERFVAADLPFEESARRDRIDTLKQLLGSAEATLTEQFRQVLDAYSSEIDYGRSLAAQRVELELAGRRQIVDILRVGRTEMYFLSLDDEMAAIFDRDSRSWRELPATERPVIKQGLRIARGTVAPELLVLPVSAPRNASRNVSIGARAAGATQ